MGPLVVVADPQPLSSLRSTGVIFTHTNYVFSEYFFSLKCMWVLTCLCQLAARQEASIKYVLLLAVWCFFAPGFLFLKFLLDMLVFLSVCLPWQILVCISNATLSIMCLPCYFLYVQCNSFYAKSLSSLVCVSYQTFHLKHDFPSSSGSRFFSACSTLLISNDVWAFLPSSPPLYPQEFRSMMARVQIIIS